MSIYRRPGSGRTLIASKQIYASHYFEASLGLTALVVSPQEEEPSFYRLHLNRSRSDAGVFRPGFVIAFSMLLNGGAMGLSCMKCSKQNNQSGQLNYFADEGQSLAEPFSADSVC